MIEPAERFPALRWNLFFMGLDIALFVGGVSFAAWTTILPLYVRHLTTSNLVLGLLPAARNLGLYLPPIFVSAHVERLHRYKPYVLWWTTLERFPYLLLAIATIGLWPAHPQILLVIFFLLMILWTAGGGITTPAWLHMVSLMIPMRLRGRFFGSASSIGGLLGVGGAAATAVILHHFRFPTNFVICFLATFVFVVLSFFALAAGREPPRAQAPAPPGQPMLTYLRALPTFLARERNFTIFLLASVLGNAVMAISPFLAVAAVRGLHVSDAQVGVYSAVLLAVTTLGSIGWGWLGDQQGYRLVLLAGTLAGVVCMAFATLALLMGSAPWFYAVFLALGAYSSALQLASFTIVTEFGAEAERPTIIALSSLVQAPMALVAPVIGGVVADRLGYHVVFIAAALALAAACALYTFAVRDPRGSESRP
ncbi:MAG TPA: MFS transporter [Chloroflexota bacterium]|nr:MFS transporter [Chloroflexota bacterium]